MPNTRIAAFASKFREEEGWIAFVAVVGALVIALTLGHIYNNANADQVQFEASQNALWKPIDAKIVSLGEQSGTYRPQLQQAVLEYRVPGSEISTQQSVQISATGWRAGDTYHTWLNTTTNRPYELVSSYSSPIQSIGAWNTIVQGVCWFAFWAAMVIGGMFFLGLLLVIAQCTYAAFESRPRDVVAT